MSESAGEQFPKESVSERFQRMREEFEKMTPEEQQAVREKESGPLPRDEEQKAAERGEVTPAQKAAAEELARQVEERRKKGK